MHARVNQRSCQESMSSVEVYPIMHMFAHPKNSAGLIAYDCTGYGLIRSHISDPRKVVALSVKSSTQPLSKVVSFAVDFCWP